MDQTKAESLTGWLCYQGRSPWKVIPGQSQGCCTDVIGWPPGGGLEHLVFGSVAVYSGATDCYPCLEHENFSILN